MLTLGRLLRALAVTIAAAASVSALAGSLTSKPGVFAVRREALTLPGGSVHATLVTPAAPKQPAFLILFVTGDAGWWGTSGVIFEHLAAQGHYAAAFDAREILASSRSADKLVEIPNAAAYVDALIGQSRRALGLPEATPVIVTGFSRGANFVVLTTGVKSLQRDIAGAIAIALTRETDYLHAPAVADRPPEVQVDEKGRIQTYPAIALAGSIPFAVIQSTGDKYVRSEEARRLFGPDTATRRLFEVPSKNHSFSGGRDELLRDLDESLGWIEGVSEAPRM